MSTKQASRMVQLLAITAGILQLLGASILKGYAAVLWILSIILLLVSLSVFIPNADFTKNRQNQTWLLILGALLLVSVIGFLLGRGV